MSITGNCCSKALLVSEISVLCKQFIFIPKESIPDLC